MLIVKQDDSRKEEDGQIFVELTKNRGLDVVNCDRAMMIISTYLKKLEERTKKANEEKDLDYEEREFKLCIEKAAPVPIGAFVPKEFTMAYNQE